MGDYYLEIDRKLALWKSKLVSTSGRLTSIRFSFFLDPKSVARRLKAIHNRFFWSGNANEKKKFTG